MRLVCVVGVGVRPALACTSHLHQEEGKKKKGGKKKGKNYYERAGRA